MTSFTVPTREAVTPANQTLFDALQGQLGFVPNLYATFALSQNALGTYLALQSAKSSINAKAREVVNLVVSQYNDCRYCLAAHTTLGKMNGFSDAQIIEIRNGAAPFPWLLRDDPLRLAGIGWRRGAVLTALAGPLFILLATGGYAHAPLAHGAVIRPSTIALASMAAATILLGERVSRAKLAGTGLILAGLAVIVGNAGATGGGMVWIGDLMFIAAGLSWTGFTILIKRWELDLLAVTAAVSVLSAPVVVPAMLVAGDFHRLAALAPDALAAQVIVQGGAAGVIAVIAFGIAVRRLGAGRSGLFPAIVPALTLQASRSRSAVWRCCSARTLRPGPCWRSRA